MPPILNIAAYRFVPLDTATLPSLRAELREQCEAQTVRGTILLSPEGINVFLAGTPDAVEAILERLRQIDGCADLEVKRSWSDVVPFQRLRVKLKREIIAFGIEGIDPAARPSPKLSAAELKRWLDEGRPVTLLDTRNDFEIEAGTFAGAVLAGVDNFRDFPAAVDRLPAALREEPLVIFCTGGIRCEKAGPLMERAGFKHVYQLDGGILKYFEDCGSAHYDGACYVFDERVALQPDLTPAAAGSEPKPLQPL